MSTEDTIKFGSDGRCTYRLPRDITIIDGPRKTKYKKGVEFYLTRDEFPRFIKKHRHL